MNLRSVWKNVQEIDLRPIRAEAERRTVFAIVSADADRAHALAAQLSLDSHNPETVTFAPVTILAPDQAERAADSDLILLLASAGTRPEEARGLAKDWSGEGRKVIVLMDSEANGFGGSAATTTGWGTEHVLIGPSSERQFLLDQLGPAIIAALPTRLLSLGRHFPMLRDPIARQVINDVCFANAAYALSTGIAEVVPVLDIPLNLADIVVLTKAQALLVYRLGLLLGLPTDWRYYTAEFGSVIGSGFLWRQAARQLVGLIPVWGIVPKVGVSYAGTYAVGHAVLRWYQTGRHLSAKEIRMLYRQAFAAGKALARSLAGRLPKPALPRLRRPSLRRKAPALQAGASPCSNCGTSNDTDARFCKQCGEVLQAAG